MKTTKKVLLVVGTRPEAIKMAPVYLELKRAGAPVVLVSTGQHGEILTAALAEFGIVPDRDLRLLRPGQGLGELMGRLLLALDPVLAREAPDVVMVHGDTLTSFGAALACFYRGIKVAHVEAGLRTGDLTSPFPEEFHRQTIASIARVHYAPTADARANLLAEGVASERVVVTGNTAVDALESVAATPALPGRRVLITLHRREGAGRVGPVLRELKERALAHPEVSFVYPLHPSPHVRAMAQEVLGGVANVRLTEPLGYRAFVNAMRGAAMIVTDSGGIQEEAAHLGVPVLLVRETTERPEAVRSGHVTLVGHSPRAIRDAFEARLAVRGPMGPSPFGSGRASGAIVEHALA